MNFEFMTIDTPLPPCMPFPRALTGQQWCVYRHKFKIHMSLWVNHKCKTLSFIS